MGHSRYVTTPELDANARGVIAAHYCACGHHLDVHEEGRCGAVLASGRACPCRKVRASTSTRVRR